MLIAIMLSLISYSLCRHAECQWDVYRSKRQSWHLHCRCLKTLVEVIMVFFPPVPFALQMNCETLHAFQFSDTTEAPMVPRILVQNGTQSPSNKTAFHGALQINWVWLIGCFFPLPECISFIHFTLTALTGRRSGVLLIQIFHSGVESRRRLSSLAGGIKDCVKTLI